VLALLYFVFLCRSNWNSYTSCWCFFCFCTSHEFIVVCYTVFSFSTIRSVDISCAYYFSHLFSSPFSHAKVVVAGFCFMFLSYLDLDFDFKFLLLVSLFRFFFSSSTFLSCFSSVLSSRCFFVVKMCCSIHHVAKMANNHIHLFSVLPSNSFRILVKVLSL
jgi:hypothetical protein